VSDARHFSREDIWKVDPRQVFEAVQAGLGMVSSGSAIAPVRAHLAMGAGSDVYLISGALPELDILTVKVINVRTGNPAQGLARLQGALTAFELSTGRPLASFDAQAATEARTAAASAVSARLLARADADVLVVFGTGPQAAAHIRALAAEWEFKEVRVVGRTLESAQQLAERFPDARAVEAAGALAGAGVVVTATNSAEPLFRASEIEPGTHVAMVGSANAAATEVEPELLGRAGAVFVDHRPTVIEESGEVVQAIKGGLLRPEAVRELGELVLGKADGRRSDSDITIYKSVGNGTQDAALAALLLGRFTTTA
jgi:ornithine cyclodeaminase/alanine dehydrogenase-like protein (mu-crystallin family)